jgi:flagellar hook-associated protein 1 FlgK
MASSLFSMLSMGSNALQTQQILLNIAGQNVANAATPGYTRQRGIVVQQPDARIGTLLFGHGSSIMSIERVRESLIDDRFRRESSILGESAVKMDYLLQLEDILGEPSKGGIALSLSDFFNSFQELANEPESDGVRTSVSGSAQSLADAFNSAYELSDNVRTSTNDYIKGTVDEINRLASEIANLNRKINSSEMGMGTSNAMRDSRDLLLNELSELASVEIRRNANGTVSVYLDGYGIVQDFTHNAIDVRFNPGLDRARDDFYEVIAVSGGNRPLDVSGGTLGGLLDVRDGVATDQLLADLDTLALELIEEVNRAHSRGQGLVQYQSLTSEFAVSDPAAALDGAGLPFTPLDGSFFLAVYDSQGTLIEQHEITIDPDTDSLDDVAAQINAVFAGGLGSMTATVTADGRLTLETAAPDTGFSFVSDDTKVGDTSDFLLSMGLNAFFTFDPLAGAAASISISETITSDVGLIAAGSSTAPGDNSVALVLAQLRDKQVLGSGGTSTLEEFFQSITVALGFDTREAIDRVDIQLGVTAGVANLRDSISGVSLDEEGVNIIRAQQAYEASARFIAAVSDMLDILLTEVR